MRSLGVKLRGLTLPEVNVNMPEWAMSSHVKFHRLAQYSVELDIMRRRVGGKGGGGLVGGKGVGGP